MISQPRTLRRLRRTSRETDMGTAKAALPRARQPHVRLSRRDWRRALLRLDRRRARAHARLQKGQTLIIFALSVTMLLGMAGLVIDVARAYDLFARMQRAADAGVVAGALYMPTYYNAARIPGDGQSAISRAMVEIYKDGFGPGVSIIPAGNPCPTPYSSVEVAICPIPNAPTDLEVIITERIDVTLLGELGVTPFTLQAHSQAEYLSPIQIGSRENYFGDQVECSPANSSNTNTSSCAPGDNTQNHLQYFMASLNGPAELKESGDPFVYCAEGDANPATLTPNNLPIGPDPNSSLTTYNGYPTDHPQWAGVPTGTAYTGGINKYCGQPVPGGTPGNPDYQPPGYDGPATAGTPHDGGDNYFIGIASSVTPSTLWIFNPFYIPQDATLNPFDAFVDNTPGGAWSPNFYQGPVAEGIGASFDGVHHDAPLFYFSLTYTLYQINNLYDRSSDTPLATETFSPYDNTSADLAYHGCVAGAQVYDPYWNDKNTVNWYHKSSMVTPGQGCVSTSLPGVCSFNATSSGWCPLENCGIGLNPATNPEKNVGSTLCTNNTQFVLQPGNAYRLAVEATGLNAGCVLNSNGTACDYKSTLQDGWGHHTYALKMCAAVGLTTPVNCPNGDGSNGAGGFNNTLVNVYAWNNDVIAAQEPLSTANANPNFPQTSCVRTSTNPYACVDLGCIPSLYAGRTVTLGLFDPGDGSGNLYVGVAPPPGAGATVTISYPSYTTTTTLDGDSVVQTRFSASSYRPFNGVWLDISIALGPNYKGDCFSTGAKSGTSGWFQIAYISDSITSAPHDELGVKFNLVGSPVHLVPPVLG